MGPGRGSVIFCWCARIRERAPGSSRGRRRVRRMASLDLLLEALRLKALRRAGWVRVGVPAPVESVADHSWGVAWLVLALLPEGLDRGKALAYAVLHDLPEVRTGDVTPMDRVPKEEKARRE